MVQCTINHSLLNRPKCHSTDKLTKRTPLRSWAHIAFCFPNRLSVFGAAFELVDRRIKGWITKRLLHGPLRHSNSPSVEPTKNGRPTDPNTPWCGRTLFFLRFLYCKTLKLGLSKKIYAFLFSCLSDKHTTFTLSVYGERK